MLDHTTTLKCVAKQYLPVPFNLTRIFANQIVSIVIDGCHNGSGSLRQGPFAQTLIAIIGPDPHKEPGSHTPTHRVRRNLGNLCHWVLAPW